MEGEVVDLTAFPIVRLDQIGRLSHELLQKAIQEMDGLLAGGSSDFNPKMVEYMRKQREVMLKTLAQRQAESRINDLLSGARSLLDEGDYSRFDSPPAKLPAKPAAQALAAQSSQTPAPSSLHSVYAAPPAQAFQPSRRLSASVRSQTVLEEEPLNEQEGTAVSISPRASGPSAPSREAFSLPLESVAHESSPRGLGTSRSNQSRRITVEEPSRRAKEVINMNFSSEFIVAATEKKKRFYPTKRVPQESAEEAKAKERLDRRKLAMERLAKRRQEREALQEHLMLQRRQEKLARRKHVLEAKAVESSSDSESVSGGDDDNNALQVAQDQTGPLPSNAQPPDAPLPAAPALTMDTHAPTLLRVPAECEDSQRSPSYRDEGTRIPAPSHSTARGAKPVPQGKPEQSRAEPATSKAKGVSKGSASVLPRKSAASGIPRRAELSRRSILPVEAADNLHPPSSLLSPASPPASSTALLMDRSTETAGDSELSQELSDELSAKNMAALSTIRRLKEMRNKASGTAHAAAPTPDAKELIGSTTAPTSNADIETPAEVHGDAPLQEEHQAQPLHDLVVEQTMPSQPGPLNPVGAELPEIFAIPSEVGGSSPATPLADERADLGLDSSQGLIPAQETLLVASSHKEAALTEERIRGCHLFDIVDDVYVFKYTADQLPGLCAWKLDLATPSTVQWEIDMDVYDDADLLDQRDEVIFQQQRSVRRKMPMGLVVLAEECQQIIMGFEQVMDSTAFITRWQHGINCFDQRAMALSSHDVHILNSSVSVCGNGYAICKKIEYLVQTFFVTDDEARLISSGMHSESSSSASMIATHPELTMQRSAIDPPALAVEEEAREDKHQAAPQGMQAPFLPASDLTRPVSGKQPGALAVPSSSIASSTEGCKLTDYYPHFGLIFPLAFSQLNHKPESWRLLQESMLQCLRVHEEWLEVMKDYSTVFCTRDDLGLGTSQSTPALGVPPATSTRTGRRTAPGGSRTAASNAIPAPNLKGSEQVYSGTASSLHYRIKSSRSEVNNILSDVFNTHFADTFTSLPSNLGLGLTWNFLWTWSKPHIKPANYNTLLAWQRLNHFMNGKELTRKDLLKKNIEKFSNHSNQAVAKEFSIMPQTFLLPNEYTQFVQTFTANEVSKKKQQQAASAGATSSSSSSSSSSPPLLNYWILKPVGLSRGRGISLVKDLADISYHTTCVVQKYLENPLCLYNHKFDLRLYVVVLSFQPLEAYIYRDGFARISTEAFSLDPNNTDNKFIHLTNSSIQKHNHRTSNVYETIQQQMESHGQAPTRRPRGHGQEEEGDEAKRRRNRERIKGGGRRGDQDDEDAEEEEGDEDGEAKEGGSKIALQGPHGLWHLLRQMPRSTTLPPISEVQGHDGEREDSESDQQATDEAGRGAARVQTGAQLSSSGSIDTDSLWESICMLVTKSLVVVNDRIAYQPNAFELFGYDVIIDDDLVPWLLEVNASPSLSRDNDLDRQVKNSLIHDIIRLLDLPPYNREKLVEVLRKRIANKTYMTVHSYMKQQSGGAAYIPDPELEDDLRAILGDALPRKWGEMPRCMGQFQRLAPDSKFFLQVSRLKKRVVKTSE